MGEITRGAIVRVGVDLAKRVIQVHAVDAGGRRVVGRTIKRGQFVAWCVQLPAGCLVAMEACSSAHHWARKLRLLGLDARLIAANFVSPYRMEGKSGKNDMTDAAAICEAASRPSMRFVAVKSCEQQGVMSLHRVREGLKEERTGCINRIRGVLAEFGFVFNKSPKALRAELADVIEDASNELSTTARLVVQRAFDHWRELDEHMRWCDSQVGQHVRSSPAARRAARITGIGELGASATPNALNGRRGSSTRRAPPPPTPTPCVTSAASTPAIAPRIMAGLQSPRWSRGFQRHAVDAARHRSADRAASCPGVRED